MRRAARIDANQDAVVSALRAAGARVLSLAPVGDGVPDLLVGHRGRLMLLEVKDGAKPPSARKKTALQERFFAEWADLPVSLVDGPEAALRALRVLEAGR